MAGIDGNRSRYRLEDDEAQREDHHAVEEEDFVIGLIFLIVNFRAQSLLTALYGYVPIRKHWRTVGLSACLLADLQPDFCAAPDKRPPRIST